MLRDELELEMKQRGKPVLSIFWKGGYRSIISVNERKWEMPPRFFCPGDGFL